jgi:hypothetical protein
LTRAVDNQSSFNIDEGCGEITVKISRPICECNR